MGDAGRVYQRLLKQGVIVRPSRTTGCPSFCASPSACPPRTTRFFAALARLTLRYGRGTPQAHVRIAKLVVVGVGLIGGSFALALKASGRVGSVVGVGRGRANLDAALARGVIDRA